MPHFFYHIYQKAGTHQVPAFFAGIIGAHGLWCSTRQLCGLLRAPLSLRLDSVEVPLRIPGPFGSSAVPGW